MPIEQLLEVYKSQRAGSATPSTDEESDHATEERGEEAKGDSGEESVDDSDDDSGEPGLELLVAGKTVKEVHVC